VTNEFATMKPLIGITTRRMPATILNTLPKGMAALSVDVIVSSYAVAVAQAGGMPVLLTMATPVEEAIERLDGVIMSGGQDVTPELYGDVPGPKATLMDPNRDAYEMALITAALDADLPLLAICRGIQILNVTLGGTLIGHLDDSEFSHATTELPPSHRRHDVIIEPGTVLAGIHAQQVDAQGRLRVNSFHHQAIRDPAPGLVPVARTPDGIIEAVEYPGHCVIGVQWHPEMHDQVDPAFTWLVDQATQHMTRA